MKTIQKVQYHVYKGRITSSPLSTFKTLYIGFEETSAKEIYNQYKMDDRVYFEQEVINIKLLSL